MIIAAFKIKLKAYYFQELFVQLRRRCGQRILEQRYVNVTVMVTVIANIDCFEVGRFASHCKLVAWLKLLNSEH